MDQESREPPSSVANELARERNREAADRTLLAWIRTSLAMISLGFAIERMGQFTMVMEGRLAPFPHWKSRTFGASLIVLGIAATLAGMWEHRCVLASIKSIDYRYTERPVIARWMGSALVVIGLAALAIILVL